MASSRLRQNPATVFDVFVEVAPPDDDEKAFILWKYPEDFEDEHMLRSITEFAFPCEFQSSVAVQLFTFVLTDLDSRYTFGFCRHAPRSHTCLCILRRNPSVNTGVIFSALPWPELFFKFLNHLASTADSFPIERLTAFLDNAYHQEIPSAGQTFVAQVFPNKNKMECVCPDYSRLPKIPENRSLTEYYNAVSEENMISVFASLLCERRVVFTSEKLGKLSACVLASNLLLYPMQCAPMPFIIGVPMSVLEEARKDTDLSEVAILDIDRKDFSSPFDEVACLPQDMSGLLFEPKALVLSLLSFCIICLILLLLLILVLYGVFTFSQMAILKKSLRSSPLVGDGLARSFLRAIVCLIGGYREALQFRPGESITFNQAAFLQTRPAHFRGFLEKMFHLQIFQQFIEDRLQKLNSGEGFMDEFEDECAMYSDKNFNKYKYQYNEWMKNMKKEGGAFVKHIRSKVNFC
ncbi:unnamed protein product [Soboliphyme baturini]|uniref:UDENN domain-containing protein n=1 Tax=Soboliphyme baturini TaxID=241478 RepID=A0A183ID85_9BILA|nr:unnamed protein product [Soboliphyme baturini]